jgi:hypothetical protein
MILVYVPIAHCVFMPDGWIAARLHVLDLAGGTVVEINSGVSALALALVLRTQLGFGSEQMRPRSPHTVAGSRQDCSLADAQSRIGALLTHVWVPALDVHDRVQCGRGWGRWSGLLGRAVVTVAWFSLAGVGVAAATRAQ